MVAFACILSCGHSGSFERFSQSVCLLTFITWSHCWVRRVQFLFSLLMWGIKEDWFPWFHHCRCRIWRRCALQAGSCYTLVRKQDLLLSGREFTFGDYICGGGWSWGGISFYLKQTWLTDGDWPHCGQTLEQLVIWLFHVQNAANLRPLWTQLIKRNRPWWILFPLLCETVCHLSNAHKDG